jgi:long-chain acyl-CoA synthetase
VNPLFLVASSRPWLKFYPPSISEHITYPEIPLYYLLEQAANEYPNKTCLRYFGRSISFREVNALANRTAGALQKLGVVKGDRIALLMPNMPQFVFAFYGILKAGGIAVPCNPLYKDRELKYQLTDCGACVLFACCDIIRGVDLYEVVNKTRDSLPALKHIITTSLTDYLPQPKKIFAGPLAKIRNKKRDKVIDYMNFMADEPPSYSMVKISPKEDIAVLQYTGGTTGISKGAMLTHYNLVSNIYALTNWSFIDRESDKILGVLPFFHIYGLSSAMNAAIRMAVPLVVLPRFDVKQVLEAIRKEGITVFPGVSTMYTAIINYPKISKYDLREVKRCISGAAPLPGEVMKTFDQLTGGRVVEGYGLSEASPVTHCNPLHDEKLVREGSIGIPIPDTDAKIVDIEDYTKELPVGEIGELAVKGPQVMKGYWNQPEETSKVLRGSWLLTGDIARMDEDGYFYIVDRKKDLINVSGFKVWPREVEEVLYTHPSIKEAAVIGVKDAYRGETVKAYVVLREDSAETVNADEISAFCKERLATYKVPKLIEFRTDLPKTLVGKVLRRKLREEEEEEEREAIAEPKQLVSQRPQQS